MESPPSSRSGNRVLTVEGRAQEDLGIGGGAWHPSAIGKAGLKGRLLLGNRKEFLGGAAAWWSQDLELGLGVGVGAVELGQAAPSQQPCVPATG